MSICGTIFYLRNNALGQKISNKSQREHKINGKDSGKTEIY